MTTRNDQIASTLQAAVQQVLARGLNDPRVRGLISVTQLDLSPDLREACIRVSVLPEEHADLTVHGLRSASGHIRSRVSQRVRLRSVPRLTFRLDESLKRQAAVEEAIRSVLPAEQDNSADGGDARS